MLILEAPGPDISVRWQPSQIWTGIVLYNLLILIETYIPMGTSNGSDFYSKVLEALVFLSAGLLQLQRCSYLEARCGVIA